MTDWRLFLAGLWWAMGAAAHAQGPAGAEFWVNSYTPGSQSKSSVAPNANGYFVVVWESWGQDGSGSAVRGQRFNAAGVPQGSEFPVNSYTTGNQLGPKVASDPTGNFVVVWQSDGQDGSDIGVFGQRFDAAGVPQGSEFQVNSYVTGGQSRPGVASDAAGSFVVVWQSDGQDGSSGGIFGQRFDAAGIPQGSEFHVNSYTTNNQKDPVLASAPNGNFMVVWQGAMPGMRLGDIFGQRFDAAGVPQGSEFQVNVYTFENQSQPAVTSDADGRFVVVWSSFLQEGGDYMAYNGVYAQRYDASGLPQGSEFRVNSYTYGEQFQPGVVSAGNGNFVVVWTSEYQEYPPYQCSVVPCYGVFGQRYDASGLPQGSEFQINSYTAGPQDWPAVASAPNGNFVVVWQSWAQDGSAYGIFGQRYGEPTVTADVSISKTDGATVAVPGTPVTYTIVATNLGPLNAPVVTVADTFPAACTGATWTCTGAGGGTCAAAGVGNINDTANLPVGGSATYVATCAISPAATGTLSNAATVNVGGGVTDPTPGNDSATDTDTLVPQADVSVTKTDGASTEVPGTSATYTIVVMDAGPSNAPVTVADTFPVACTGATWTCTGAGGATCTAAGSGNLNDTAYVPVGGSATYLATCAISPSATGTLSNTATATAGVGVIDPTPGNNSATDTNTLTPQADVSVSKSDPSETDVPGTPVTYTIVAANTGPSNAPVVTVADAFPAVCTGATWTCASASGGACTASGSGNISDPAVLPPGGSATYVATCAILSSATGTLSNTATATPGGGVADPVPVNNSATDTNALTPHADLSVSMGDAPDPVAGLGTLFYFVTVANGGPSDGNAVSAALTLPSSVSFVSATGSGWSCSAGTSAVTCTRPSLPLAATFSVMVTVGAASGTLTASVTVTASSIDPNTANNSASEETTVTGAASADLSVALSDGGETALWGRPLTYSLTVENGGPDGVTGATVSDNFPAGLASVSWTCTASSGSSCTAAGSGSIGDTVVNLLAAGTATYSATGMVVPGTASPLVNTATVSASIHDPVAANNSSTVSTPVDVDLIFKDGFEGPP